MLFFGLFRNATRQQVTDLGLGSTGKTTLCRDAGWTSGMGETRWPPGPLLLRGQFTHGACCPPTPTGECELVWSLGQWGARRQETCPASPLYLPLVSASPAMSIPVQRRLCDGRFSLSPPPFHCLVSSTFPSLLTLTSLHLKKFPWIFNVIHTTFRFFFGLKSITCIYQKGIQQMLCHLFAVLHVAPFCEYSPNFVCILSITKRV